RWLVRVGVDADARHDVGEVDAAGSHVDAHRAWPQGGIGPLCDLEDVRPAVLRDFYRSHRDQTTRLLGIVVRACRASRASALRDMATGWDAQLKTTAQPATNPSEATISSTTPAGTGT